MRDISDLSKNPMMSISQREINQQQEELEKMEGFETQEDNISSEESDLSAKQFNPDEIENEEGSRPLRKVRLSNLSGNFHGQAKPNLNSLNELQQHNKAVRNKFQPAHTVSNLGDNMIKPVPKRRSDNTNSKGVTTRDKIDNDLILQNQRSSIPDGVDDFVFRAYKQNFKTPS